MTLRALTAKSFDALTKSVYKLDNHSAVVFGGIFTHFVTYLLLNLGAALIKTFNYLIIPTIYLIFISIIFIEIYLITLLSVPIFDKLKFKRYSHIYYLSLFILGLTILISLITFAFESVVIPNLINIFLFKVEAFIFWGVGYLACVFLYIVFAWSDQPLDAEKKNYHYILDKIFNAFRIRPNLHNVYHFLITSLFIITEFFLCIFLIGSIFYIFINLYLFVSIPLIIFIFLLIIGLNGFIWTRSPRIFKMINDQFKNMYESLEQIGLIATNGISEEDDEKKSGYNILWMFFSFSFFFFIISFLMSGIFYLGEIYPILGIAFIAFAILFFIILIDLSYKLNKIPKIGLIFSYIGNLIHKLFHTCQREDHVFVLGTAHAGIDTYIGRLTQLVAQNSLAKTEDEKYAISILEKLWTGKNPAFYSNAGKIKFIFQNPDMNRIFNFYDILKRLIKNRLTMYPEKILTNEWEGHYDVDIWMKTLKSILRKVSAFIFLVNPLLKGKYQDEILISNFEFIKSVKGIKETYRCPIAIVFDEQYLPIMSKLTSSKIEKLSI